MIIPIVISFVCFCFYLFFKFRFNRRLLRPFQSESCRSDSDCGDRNVCFGGRCLRKIGSECDRGEWVIAQYDDGETVVACACKHTDLTAQSVPGGNCDVDRVCAPLGSLVWAKDGTADCSCPEGYVSRRNLLDGKPYCARTTVSEKQFEQRCKDDEIDLLNPLQAKYLDPAYVARFPNIRCVKAPCRFDALTNRPLKYTMFVKDFGCVCDPRRGNIGVWIDDLPNYVNGAGYNACVNIFEKGEPQENISDVTLYTYYYVLDKRPIAFVQFSNLRLEILSPPFRSILKDGMLQIEEMWPFDYSQYVLMTSGYVVWIRGDSACKTYFSLTNIKNRCKEFVADNRELKKCKDLARDYRLNPSNFIFNHPVCIVEPGDMQSTKFYDKKIVSNPLHITAKYSITSDTLKRHLSNGIELKMYDAHRWLLDFAPTTSDYLDGTYSELVPNYEHD